MKFGEVIDALKNGLPIRRNAWDEGTYTYYDFDKYMFIDMFVSGNFYESQDAPFGLADLAADDWEIHEWDEETRLEKKMAKYRLNLSFDIDISADEEEEKSEEEMVDILQGLYYNDKTELLATLRYYFEVKKVAYHLEIKPQKAHGED